MSSMMKFVIAHKADITCKRGQSPTHLKLNGGKLAIDDDLVNAFIVAYGSDVQKYTPSALEDRKHLLCMTEVVSFRAPFFVDLDIADAEGVTEPTDQDIRQMCISMAQGIAGCITADEVTAHEDKLIQNGVDVSVHRQTLLPSTFVIVRAKSRLITKQEKQYTKTGVHVLWPNLIVDKETAKRLREVAVTQLYESHPTRSWEDIVDIAVYRNMSSLRMIGSYKVIDCASCKVGKKDDDSDEKSLRATVASKMDRHGQPIGAKEARLYCLQQLKKLPSNNMTVRAIYDNYLAAYQRVRCMCGGFKRIADVASGAYCPVDIVTKEGNSVEDLVSYMNKDYTIAVHICSVRRQDSTPLTPLVFPNHCPCPVRVQFEPISAEALHEMDVNPNYVAVEVEKSRGYQSPTQNKLIKEDITDNRMKSIVQRYLRSGALGFEYNKIQVKQLYRLYSNRRGVPELDQNTDGTPYYSVIASVRGFGSQYCHAVHRDHSSNEIYFEFTPDQKCVQKCRSSKNSLCSKPSKVVDAVGFQVYVNLFKYTLRTVNVLPEEEQAWNNKVLPDSYVKKYLSKVLYVPRGGKVPVFKLVVSLGRKRRARFIKTNNEVNSTGKRLGFGELVELTNKRARFADENDDDYYDDDGCDDMED